MQCYEKGGVVFHSSNILSMNSFYEKSRDIDYSLGNFPPRGISRCQKISAWEDKIFCHFVILQPHLLPELNIVDLGDLLRFY